MKLDTNHWPTWSTYIAAPADPIDFNEASVSRLMRAIAPYVVDVKNVRSQFNAINRIKMIDFETQKDREQYGTAYIRYVEACTKIGKTQGGFAELVELLKFNQEAEIIRAPFLASQLYQNVQEGFAAVSACKYKATIAKIALTLNQRYGVPREKISIIWGGSSIYAGGEKITMQEIKQMLKDVMMGLPVDKRKLEKAKQQLLAQNSGLGEIPSDLELGPQDYDMRQDEIDRFQRGDSHYCLFNFKSGGVGLSLHHSDDLTQQKVRRNKDSGYAVEEDIPKIPTRPRTTFLAPTYSAIELVQGLGRVPRITSLSDTVQIMCFYRGTVEVAVAAIVSQKLRCLKQVVRQRETWEDIIFQHRNDNFQQLQLPEETTVEGDNILEIQSGSDEDEE